MTPAPTSLLTQTYNIILIALPLYKTRRRSRFLNHEAKRITIKDLSDTPSFDILNISLDNREGKVSRIVTIYRKPAFIFTDAGLRYHLWP